MGDYLIIIGINNCLTACLYNIKTSNRIFTGVTMYNVYLSDQHMLIYSIELDMTRGFARLYFAYRILIVRNIHKYRIHAIANSMTQHNFVTAHGHYIKTQHLTPCDVHISCLWCDFILLNTDLDFSWSPPFRLIPLSHTHEVSASDW